MELEDLVNEYQFRRCRGQDGATPNELADAFAFFCANYVYIKHPNNGKIKFDHIAELKLLK